MTYFIYLFQITCSIVCRSKVKWARQTFTTIVHLMSTTTTCDQFFKTCMRSKLGKSRFLKNGLKCPKSILTKHFPPNYKFVALMVEFGIKL